MVLSGLLGGSSSNSKPAHHHHHLHHAKEADSADGQVPADADDTEDLDEENGSILLHLISQLRIGMDLSKVTLPTFVLEPRSMLERITDFLSYPDLIFGASELADPVDRFVAVTRYYLAGWHIKPKGVKKPYNPVLGEYFTCSYQYKDGSHGYYISEQVSHHPPVSAYFYCAPEHNVVIYGELRPKSKFLGNSAATLMGGESRVVFLDRESETGGKGEEYVIGMPNIYARGILFGKLLLELGDTSAIDCAVTKTSASVDFKTKGYFSGTYNALDAKVAHAGKQVGLVQGKWSDLMTYTDQRASGKQGGHESVLFSVRDAPSPAAKSVKPEAEQAPNESRRLWNGVTLAIQKKDMHEATEYKSAIEDAQRACAKEREEAGQKFEPHYFVYAPQLDRFLPRMGALPSEFQAPAVASYFAGFQI